MRTFILSIMAALAGMACRAQESKPEGGVRILTAGQHITLAALEVTVRSGNRALVRYQLVGDRKSVV